MYSVAMSLDGFIAGENDEYDWIPMDPDIDFKVFTERFDTVLMGRRSFEIVSAQPEGGLMPGMKTFVASRTLRQEEYPQVTIINSGLKEAVTELRKGPGKDIWLFGGGALFGSLLDSRLVDVVEVAVVPILLRVGKPMVWGSAAHSRLRLLNSKTYSTTGIVFLEYAVDYE
jgi:dihydrofolate reductase